MKSSDKLQPGELLLAWAYLDTQQPDKAEHGLDEGDDASWIASREAVRAANVLGTLPGGALPGLAMLFAPAADPRADAFDWETWYEVDVLRRELACPLR